MTKRKAINYKYFHSAGAPQFCRLKELLTGEASDFLSGIDRRNEFAKVMPDIFTYTQDDVLKCQDIDDLPDDWRRLADVLIRKYKLDN
jgi:hypothetical protein